MSHFTAQPFSQAWTLADTREYLATDDSRPDYQSQPKEFETWRRDVFGPVHDRLQNAVVCHLLDLAHAGRLGPLRHVEGTDVAWMRNWNAILAGKVDHDALGYSRGMGFTRGLSMRLATQKRSEQDVQALHQTLVDIMERGDFSDYDIEDMSECRTTGERFVVRMQGWQPTVGRIAKVEGARFGVGFVPLQGGEFKEPGVEHVVIPLPSGELLINDWFRIPEFTELTKQLRESSPDFDVSAVNGCAEQTRCYAEQLGFVSVSVDNTMPAVVLDDGVVKVGRLHRDEESDDDIAPAGRKLGSVCTDLWWATMIDREVLTSLVAGKVGRREAETKVAAMLDEQKSTGMVVHLPPGEYHLYFSGDRRVFARKFASKEVSMQDFSNPMLVLSPTPLTLVDPAPKRRPSP